LQPNVVIPAGQSLGNASYNSNLDATIEMSGNRLYELNNHLGNVLVTVNDILNPGNTYTSTGGASTFDYATANVMSAQDYYPFGMQMPGRTYLSGGSSNYRYGFNGKENDNEVEGVGNQIDYGMRAYDPRAGRFMSLDPLTKKFPFYAPYQYAGNSPILAKDLDGMESTVNKNKNEKAVTDAGHGINDDNGAKNDDGTTEASMALMLETATSKALEKFGISDTRTRTTDDATAPGEEQVDYRARIANASGANVFVSFHLNAGDKVTNNILLVYPPLKTDEGNAYASDAYNTNSLKLGDYLKTALSTVFTGREIVPTKGTMPDVNYHKLGVLNQFDQADHAAILIEFGPVIKSENVAFLKANADQIGTQVATAIYRYLNNGQDPPAEKPKPEAEHLNGATFLKLLGEALKAGYIKNHGIN
jgi:RHS repeat-associated protein